MTQKGTTMQKIDRPALRVALRSSVFLLSLVVTVLYVAASIYAGGPVVTTVIYSVLFAVIASVWLIFGYRDVLDRRRWAARAVADAARAAERQAEHDAWLAEHDEIVERRDIERDIERADHWSRVAEITRTGTDPGPSEEVRAIEHHRQAERDTADEQYRIERAARQARIARRQKQGTA